MATSLKRNCKRILGHFQTIIKAFVDFISMWKFKILFEKVKYSLLATTARRNIFYRKEYGWSFCGPHVFFNFLKGDLSSSIRQFIYTRPFYSLQSQLSKLFGKCNLHAKFENFFPQKSNIRYNFIYGIRFQASVTIRFV